MDSEGRRLEGFLYLSQQGKPRAYMSRRRAVLPRLSWLCSTDRSRLAQLNKAGALYLTSTGAN
eukprot:scaffold75447_cov19-Prasinocladus_malaysianus.AAC.1